MDLGTKNVKDPREITFLYILFCKYVFGVVPYHLKVC